MSVLERALDELHEGPLERFVERRNELAASLRRDGDRESARAVRSIRKPTVPVWVINRVARKDEQATRRVIEAGTALREAHERVLRGEDPARLRDATNRERDAVQGFVERAREVLDDAGQRTTASVLERVRDTVYAVAADESLHERFRAGRVTEEHERVGFGEFTDVPVSERPRDRRETKRQRERREREEERRREREARIAELRGRYKEADDEADALERRARTARRRADAIREQLEAAERAATSDE